MVPQFSGKSRNNEMIGKNAKVISIGNAVWLLLCLANLVESSSDFDLFGTCNRVGSPISDGNTDSQTSVSRKASACGSTSATVCVIGGATTASALTSNYNQDQGPVIEARVSHVRHILSKRLGSVLSGGRAKQFEKWASKQGDLKVISMHGVDESELDFDKINETDAAIVSSDGIFPDNAINLALVPVQDMPSLYTGTPAHTMDEGAVSHLNLFFRSIRLGFNFAPVASTAWLAFLSTTFREKLWYNWVASCLSLSGPAFIKWGELA